MVEKEFGLRNVFPHYKELSKQLCFGLSWQFQISLPHFFLFKLQIHCFKKNVKWQFMKGIGLEIKVAYRKTKLQNCKWNDKYTFTLTLYCLSVFLFLAHCCSSTSSVRFLGIISPQLILQNICLLVIIFFCFIFYFFCLLVVIFLFNLFYCYHATIYSLKAYKFF